MSWQQAETELELNHDSWDETRRLCITYRIRQGAPMIWSSDPGLSSPAEPHDIEITDAVDVDSGEVLILPDELIRKAEDHILEQHEFDDGD